MEMFGKSFQQNDLQNARPKSSAYCSKRVDCTSMDIFNTQLFELKLRAFGST